ncbi:2-methylisocitrate lyase-like PEP mutase family enzyme [Actinomadura pelletieri DSM 43383]|uniref:2-methylisocitrate lyase-like PEP mutase family enzyme n=1 Tax=Actinomadura pelletieri DSM 43383 TaxID=1120940 RepID=A0A495QKT6_9ACTN|nr:oxaloacetate decarboxylase [Actinomadura pelletieri]RKS73154.1 2-methylisocitrate lyase-like PEP mutase family enzyme [Actinomadura pelletieri DSM 43383]
MTPATSPSRTGGAALLDLARQGPVMLAGCYDGLSAAALQEAGFRALAVSGAGVSASLLGVPDLGLLTLTELVGAVRHIAARSAVPVVVDADTGFGNQLNVARTVEELTAVGVAAIQLEDQVSPKRCGHLDGKAVVGAEEFVAKIAAADHARAGRDTLLIARTDALAVEGLDSAVDRANRCLDAGADVTFVEAPRTLADLDAIAERVPGPKLYNLATGGRSPSLTVRELGERGFDLVVLPAVAMFAALESMRRVAGAVLAAGDDTPVADLGLTVTDFYGAVGLERWLDLDARFAG